MGKVFVILLMVLGIWAATEYASGNDPFASDPQGSPSEEATLVSKSGSKVQAAHEEASKRRESLLGD